MSQTLIKELEDTLQNLLDKTEHGGIILEATYKTIFFDALKEHTDFSQNQIHREWLKYYATNLRFK
jgi:hypothetical protein